MITEQPEGQEPVVEQIVDETQEVVTPAPVQVPAPTPAEVTLDQVQGTQAYRNIQSENDRLRNVVLKNEQFIQGILEKEDTALLEEFKEDPKVTALIQERATMRTQLGKSPSTSQAQEEALKIQCAQSVSQEFGVSYDSLMAADVSTATEMEAYAKALKAVGGLAMPQPAQTPTTPTREPALPFTPDAAIATQQPLSGWPQVQEAYSVGKISTAEYQKQAAIHGKEP